MRRRGPVGGPLRRTPAAPRLLAVGDSAVTVEFGDTIDPALNARVRALDASLGERPFPGFVEAVPSYRSLLVLYDPLVAGFAAVEAALSERLAARAAPSPPARRVTIPARYGGEDGPDLPEIAAALGLTEDEVVARHTGAEYTAFMLGFMPGFAYCGLLPQTLETRRRATPRPRVPAGSVAIAGRQTGVYPVSSPGGWNLIGRTTLQFFEPGREPPCLVQPGDQVCFASVPDLPPAATPLSPPPPSSPPAVLVEDGGLLTTVQDMARRGHRRLGVGGAGAMDTPAHALANRLVGNEPDAAALECTVSGPILRFLRAVRFAVTGADLGAVLQRSDLGAWPVPLATSVFAREGNLLSFTGRRSGCRVSLAFAGGIDVPPVLGSRATDFAAGFGGGCGRPLRAGDPLALGPAPAAATLSLPIPHPLPTDLVTVRVILGPQDVGGAARRAFLDETWLVDPTSDRIGLRLSGNALAVAGAREIVSDGMVPGCIQVPPDGRPIVMMADAPTTGGYPKVAVVITADLPLLAQAVPGVTRVRFDAITVKQAQGLLRPR